MQVIFFNFFSDFTGYVMNVSHKIRKEKKTSNNIKFCSIDDKIYCKKQLFLC